MEEIAKKSIFKRWWFWVIVFIVVIIIAASSGGDSKSPQTASNGAATNSTAKESPVAAQDNNAKNDGSISEGMYKVGKDITAGEYVLIGDGAYYQVSKDSSGTLESIISNDNFKGSRYITVKDGNYIEFKNAKMSPIDKAPVFKEEDGKYQPGMYKVGRDIDPGEYKVVSDGGSAYVEVAKNSAGGLDSIVSNDNFTGNKYVSVQQGQYIKLVNCYITK
jgi:hypothetical protein